MGPGECRAGALADPVLNAIDVAVAEAHHCIMTPASEPEEDPFADLPPHLAEQLAKAEKKFNPAPKEQNKFSDFPELNREYIIGTHFTAYRNENAGKDESEIPEAFAEYREAPILLHSEKNRFANLCDLAMKGWMPEFTEFLETLIALEKEASDPENEALSEELEHNALSFGLQVNPDTYVVGYTGPETAIFARKELLLRLILFINDCMTQVGSQGAPAGLLDEIRALLNTFAPDAK